MSDSATPWTVPDGLLCAWDFPPRILEWTAAPGALPKPGVKPTAPALQVASLLLSHQGSPSYLLTLYIMFLFFFPATLCSTQDLSSITWDWTQGPCIGSSDFPGPSGKSHTLVTSYFKNGFLQKQTLHFQGSKEKKKNPKDKNTTLLLGNAMDRESQEQQHPRGLPINFPSREGGPLWRPRPQWSCQCAGN